MTTDTHADAAGPVFRHVRTIGLVRQGVHMSIPSLTELIPILQVAIGPAILISGVGLLLLSMTNRFGQAVERSRILSQKLRAMPSGDRARTLAQIRILSRRAGFIRQGIILATLSLLMAAILIITLFLLALFRMEAAWLVVSLFIACLLFLIGSLVAFIRDVNHSLEALKLELEAEDAPDCPH